MGVSFLLNLVSPLELNFTPAYQRRSERYSTLSYHYRRPVMSALTAVLLCDCHTTYKHLQPLTAEALQNFRLHSYINCMKICKKNHF